MAIEPGSDDRPFIEVSVTGTIEAPAGAVWATIADFGSAASYFPNVLACIVEGEGIGARRYLPTDDGGRTVSELTELDPARMTMGYRVVESSLPIDDYSSRVVVRAAGDRCELTYSSRFRARDGSAPPDVEQLIGAALRSALTELRRLHE